MDPEIYKVEVLHFINPYLIWVEVFNLDSDNYDNFCFEQIGIYGVLPLEMTMNLLEDTLTTKRTTDWMPAATVLMKNLLADAVEVSFLPVHIEHRSTIFDDNIHKYGEIVIKKSNGKYRQLSKLLVKNGFAIYDENLFQHELSSGNIKTKLSHNKVKDIIKHLEKKCKAQVDKQSKIFRTAQRIESALTEKNLEAHNRRTKVKPDDFERILQNKLKDLNMCKDAELEAVGRASKKSETNSDTSSVLLIKKLNLYKNKSKQESGAAEYFIKQRLEDLDALQKPKLNIPLMQSTYCADIDDFFAQQKGVISIQNEKNNNTEQNLESAGIGKNSGQFTEVPIKEVRALNKSFEDDNLDEGFYKKAKKPKKANSSPNKLPDYNIHKESRIAYGPPGMNFNALPCKIIPKEEFIEKLDTPETKEEMPAKIEIEDVFAEEDSVVNINVKILQKEPASRVSDTLQDKNVNISNAQKPTNDIATFKIDNPVKGIVSNVSNCQTSGHECSSLLKRKLRLHKDVTKMINSSATSDTTNKDSSTSFEDDRLKKRTKDVKNTSIEIDSDDETVSEVIEKINSEYKPIIIPKKEEPIEPHTQLKNHVNPFKNVDTNISKFVEKLVTPVLMVHSKMDKRVQPVFKLRDVQFNTHIQIILKNMAVEQPMMIQTVSWCSILRGYSTFIIGPKKSGKTLGYLPAICRLVSDKDSGIDSIGPMSIIVCATSNSVSEIETLAKIFFANKERVLAIYSGMNELDIVTSLLNGCDLLICTPAILVRLLQVDFGVDLRRLTSFVIDDCERVAEVHGNEIKYFLIKIKEMLKTRVQKEVKVQYILASRVWCGFMESLSKKAPDTLICIGAFQECVLYSKAKTTASFVTKENKIKNVLEFLKDIDNTKRSVIVCRTDEEVDELQKALTEAKYVVFVCNNEMTLQDLYNLRGTWDDYQEPLIGPILLCVDGNLTHLNITDAHYLVHYSLPSLFSAFCKRFATLNDNYPSIFKEDNEDVKIKILLEDINMEQLPKILNFIKRCTTEVPTVLDDMCQQILAEKDKIKAQKLVPVCDNLLTLGECPDFWNCQERHAVVGEVDEPQAWVPKEGIITFKILHYHTAVLYSANLLTNITAEGQINKYSQNYSMLAMKISMHFGRDSNRRLHGVPQVGDICAVSIRQNFFVRCQVVKILSYYLNGKPNHVLVRLIDEEKLEKTRDICLYYLPEDLIKIQTHVVHVRLANLQPKDKDITFSNLARDQLKKITDSDEDLYLRGQVAFTIGNCVIVEFVEACRDLATLNKTVVLHDFKKILLEKHAVLNEDHLQRLEKLCIEGGLKVSVKKATKVTELLQPAKILPPPQWAHLEKDDFSVVLFASAEDPSTFFVRLEKFKDSCNVLVKDIQKYAAENSETLINVVEGDIVLAKLPDDDMFERARIDKVLNNDKFKCFFVDHGDWREVNKLDLIPISAKLIAQLPFQAIECRLLGVKPPGDSWTEFATIWFTNCFEDKFGDLKQIYARYFTKQKATHTGGHKYGVVLIDTNSEEDVVVNNLILEVNLAQEEESEVYFLNNLNFEKRIIENRQELSDDDDLGDSWEKVSKTSRTSSNINFNQSKISLKNVFPEKPIRSVPLIGSDESETSENRWQINMTEDFMTLFKPFQAQKATDFTMSNLPTIKHADSSESDVSDISKSLKNTNNSSDVDTDISVKISSASQLVTTPKIKELDSDDYTSPEDSILVTKPVENQSLLKEIATSKITKNTTKSNDINPTNKKTESDSLRKPKLLWHQKEKSVVVKILLIGVEDYNLTIEDRRLKFYAIANDTEYGFDIELYGIVDKKGSIHSNKGQYIWMCLPKVLDINWLSLTKTVVAQKWIVYDLDSIDISSDEENDDRESKEAMKQMCKSPVNSESEDEEFNDDVNFQYSR